MTTLADLRQASTKMVPAENDVVADGAIDLPENGVFPQTDSLIQKLEDIMKRINTVCLKDFANLMEYRKDLSEKKSKPKKNNNPSKSISMMTSILTSSVPGLNFSPTLSTILETISNTVTGAALEPFSSISSNTTSSSYSSTSASGPSNLLSTVTIDRRPLRGMRMKSATNQARQQNESNSLESVNEEDSATFPASNVSAKMSKIPQGNATAKASSQTSPGPLGPSKYDTTNKCLETLIEFAGFTKDFRIWYLERLRKASSIVLRSLDLQK
ncbi:uncharacterized protein LOC141850919 [Brevipalpus obovatus]|uniref:uncharacterized protein LOC141850919 n=1 Tax=Brevipalpus obovatus TaxID=246614 RepID=UPI003D9EA228